MKMQMNIKRLLPVLLSLVLLISLLPLAAVTASASGNSFAYAYDCQRSVTWPKVGGSFQATDIKNPYGSSGTRVEPSGDWVLTSKGYYTSGMSLGASSHLGALIANIAREYDVDPAQVEVYQLTKDGVHIAYGTIFTRSSNGGEIVTFLGDNWNGAGCTYLLSDSEISGSRVITISQDLKTAAPPLHIHSWSDVTSSPGLKVADTTITCTGCHETLTVSLKAEDITLPGNVFNAQLEKTSGAPIARTTQVAANPLKVSATPGYQYSPNGSGFTPIHDPNGFTPKQGIYQASVLVTDDANLNVNLFVKYTVSDPAVTAATGDSRPIEWMLTGLFAFGIMAAAAFALDGRQKSAR